MDPNLPENKDEQQTPEGQSVASFGTSQDPAQTKPEEKPAEEKPLEVKPVQPAVEKPAELKPQPAAPAAAPKPAVPAPKPAAPAPKPAVPVPKPAVPVPKPGKRFLSKEELIQREKVRNKKILLGCGGSFGCGTILLIILIFVFVGQAGTESSALAQAFGVDQQSLVNTLILIINLFFGIGAFIAFILSIGGIFRATMARKDDSITRRKGYILSGGAFGALILIIVLWVGAWFYLNNLKIPETPRVAGIVTEPESTINLTAPVEITFDASKLPFDTRNYDIISYFWDFGDGSAGAGQSTEQHRYERKGDGRYDVKLTLTFKNKNTGEESTETLTHIITIADEQVAAVLTADTTSGDAPLTVKFDGSESADPDGTIDTYAWEIDGKGFQEGDSTFEYTFDQVGVYTVRLRVTNTKGDFNIAEEQITVSAGAMPVASIEILNDDGGRYYVNKSYTFDASGSSSPSGNITSYEWDFGDGTSKARSRTAQHSFSSEGIYKVILTIIDEEGVTGEKEIEVEVELAPSSPDAIMETDPAKEKPEDTSIEGTVPFEVNFNATKSTDPDDDIIDYQWDFDGDGEYDAAGEITSYVFNEPGSYNVSLVVVDSAGFEGRDILLVKALSRGLEAQVTAEPVSGVVPLTVAFDATGSSYSDGQIVSYEWNFGDGSAPRSDVGTVTYKYTKIGNFTASVKVRTNDNIEETDTILISVRQVPLKSCFEPTNTVGDAPFTATFNPQCSTGTIAKYKWDFGDGETSAERKPTHTYENPGGYEVQLEVADAQNVVDISSQFITVTGELTQ